MMNEEDRLKLEQHYTENILRGNERLIADALTEIAEHLGHSLENPISSSLLCLNFGITHEQRGKLLIAFQQILIHNKSEDLSLELFKEAVDKSAPQMGKNTWSDLSVKALVKGFAKNLIPQLIPFADTL